MATITEIIGSQGESWAGTDNTYAGVDGQDNALFGDVSETLLDQATGGDDTLTGGAASPGNALYGDATFIYGYAAGGDDALTGGANSSSNTLYGDAAFLFESAAGGNDTLVGGANASRNTLYGDAAMITNSAIGGDDTLVGGAGSSNDLYGDAKNAFGTATCGNDRLVSGTGMDRMWGDANYVYDGVLTGSDVFAFAAGNSQDVICDFEAGKDLIDLSALDLSAPDAQHADLRIPIHKLPAKALAALQAHHPKMASGSNGFAVLDSNSNGVLDDADAFVSVADGNTVLDLGAAMGGDAGLNTVEVVGQTALVAGDFVF